MTKILLDLNNPVFQEDLFNLSKSDSQAVLKTLRKISQLEWKDLYKDKGLRWELIRSKQGKKNDNLYSIRITQKCRAVVKRQEDYLRFLSLHSDHDSAY